MYTIRSEVDAIDKKMKALFIQLKKIQARCSHPVESLSITHGSNTGNYDIESNFYWTNFECKMCDKRWSEEHS